MRKSLEWLAGRLSSLNDVRAIGISGPIPERSSPGISDLDLFLYCRRIPDACLRHKMLETSGGAIRCLKIDVLSGGPWGIADSLYLENIETWMMYFTLEEARSELDAILCGDFLDRGEDGYYPIGRCAMYARLVSLYDPDGFLVSLQERVAAYPEALRRKMIAYHISRLEDTEDLERAVYRSDPLFYHFALDLALDHLLMALFALNSTFFPSRKRSFEFIENFKIKP